MVKISEHDKLLKLPEPEVFTGQLRGVEAWAPIRKTTDGIEVLDLNCIASTKEKVLDRIVSGAWASPLQYQYYEVQRVAKVLIVIHSEEK